MSYIASLLEERLSPGYLRHLRRASGVATQYSVQLYLVGGTVRDILLGRRVLDLDISMVGATPEFPAALARELGGEVTASSQFGTAKLRVGDASIDLAMARRESYAHPGALPTVASGSIEEDLARRDFSINAMAVSLAPGAWGELLDPHGGQRDIGRRLIRALHSRSFIDDATRILRAIRYAQRLGFSLEGATERLMRRDLSYLDTIKGDRVRHELERIFTEEHAASMLEMAQRMGVLRAIYATLSLNEPMLAKIRQIRPEQNIEHSLVILSLLSYNIPLDQQPGFIARLSMDSTWAQVVRDTGRVRAALDQLRTPDLWPSQIYELLQPFHPISIRGCALAADEPLVARRLELYLTELMRVRPLLNGDDLIALGVPWGPAVGLLLKELLMARLDGQLNTRQDEERYVIARLKSGA
jgi:tRNA nucleotidyltransferase (CCA-adding enzyme)